MPADIGMLNRLNRASFVAAIAEVTEHSTWVQEAIADQRPFASVDALWTAMMTTIGAAPVATQLAMIRLHPELAGVEAQQGVMAANSTHEQARLGLTAMSADDLRTLHDLNARYQARFGYPCIIALWRHEDIAGIFRAFEARLDNDPAVEMGMALSEIGEVMRGRLSRLFASVDAA